MASIELVRGLKFCIKIKIFPKFKVDRDILNFHIIEESHFGNPL